MNGRGPILLAPMRACKLTESWNDGNCWLGVGNHRAACAVHGDSTGLTLLVKSWWRMEDKIEDTNTNFDRKIENLRTENQKAHSEIRTNIDGLENVLIANKINSQQRPDA